MDPLGKRNHQSRTPGVGETRFLSPLRGGLVMIVSIAVAAVGGIVLGFVAGLCTYRVSRRWCPVCGEDLKCFRCLGVMPVKHARTETSHVGTVGAQQLS